MDTPREASAGNSLLLPAVTIFLSAFLLFQVQPMVGKLVVPWFGGSAGVWTTCLLFFQALLLLGYLYAHLVVRHLSHARQVRLHGALLVAALLTLPLRLHPWFRPSGGTEPLGRLLGLLLVTIGLPYLALSTTGPLVQAWVARRGQVPYRLFALSNLASMLALFSYPVFVEPFLPMRSQSWLWSAGFVAFAALVFFVALKSAPEARDDSTVSEVGEAPGFAMKLLWIAFAAVPSVLLMAVTTHLSTNVAPIPFLWVLPLGLYLLSFILCFDSTRWYRRGFFLTLLPFLLVVMSLSLRPNFRYAEYPVSALSTAAQWLGSVRGQVALFSLGLFVACMVAHGELSRRRPHPRFLTGFYLRLSLGGALGGLFVAWLAPRIFTTYLELPLGLAAAGAMAALALAWDPGQTRRWRSALGMGSVALFLGIHSFGLDRDADRIVVARSRNFYGTLAVYDNPERGWRVLAHGTITHGGQFLDPAKADRPSTYYSEDSGVGLALTSLQEGPRKLGVVGLGAGSLAAYGRPGDQLRFYEINALVEPFARRHFTYLDHGKATTEVVLGDARLSLEAETPQGYDLLAIDAFSSDSIPVHLLTREAFGLYFRHLNPDGVLAVHVSNRYLALQPVVRAAVNTFHKQARVVDTDSDQEEGAYGSTWVLISRDEAFFSRPAFQNNEDVKHLPGAVLPWRDDFSNLFRALK
ncbi:spermidine synthase [Geothrix sp. PMB-07]|uniref:spermidine synthase n=1 Tax=Geothrix sp. PMB-07 TaxID=3068640 RepID=UPI00274214E4|nr:fused MFS/spermidine synthase [Geothrix sp. PMB-07]WLT31394.1 fused MFS/spermidine synthase [Geothrix sp. PMB-07]